MKFEDKVVGIGLIVLMVFCGVAVFQTFFLAQTYTENIRVVKINNVWNGDTAPYENVTLSNGQQLVFSCDYYKINSTVRFSVQYFPILFWTSNVTYPEIVKGC